MANEMLDQPGVLSAAGPAGTVTVGNQALIWSAAFFTAAVLIHNADHVRRGADAVASDVFWVGTAAIALEVAVVLLCCQRHRLAPVVAAGAGLQLTAGYLIVHFLPARSWLSDSFTDGPAVSPVSLFAASLEVAAAATLGVVGLAVLRQRGGLATAWTEPYPRQRPLRAALLHPVALTMTLGNAVILALSFARS
jgi:hypothetical protein